MAAHVVVGMRFANEFDVLDILHGDALQHGVEREGLVGRTLAVDQEVAEAVAQAAPVGIAARQGEARHALHHVQRGDGRIAGEETRTVDRDTGSCFDNASVGRRCGSIVSQCPGRAARNGRYAQ